jgi:hypothetical protein
MCAYGGKLVASHLERDWLSRIVQSFDEKMLTGFRQGDNVVILKKGRFLNCTAAVIGLWNGRIKVRMNQDDSVKSYMPYDLRSLVFSEGEHVRIAKPGTYKGQTCTIVDPAWGERIKVRMADGSTKSYLPTEMEVPEKAVASIAHSRNHDYVESLDKSMLAPRFGDLTESVVGPIDDYAELAVMLGFLLLFSITYPPTGLLVLASCYLEANVDALKFRKLLRRPIPVPSTSIGVWEQIFVVMLMIAGPVNAGLLVWTVKLENYPSVSRHLLNTGRNGWQHRLAAWLILCVLHAFFQYSSYMVTKRIGKRTHGWQLNTVNERLRRARALAGTMASDDKQKKSSSAASAEAGGPDADAKCPACGRPPLRKSDYRVGELPALREQAKGQRSSVDARNQPAGRQRQGKFGGGYVGKRKVTNFVHPA